MRCLAGLLSLALVLVVGVFPARSVDPPAATIAPPAGRPRGMQCLREARAGYGACAQRIREECQREFRTALEGCFGPDNPCPRACFAADERCRLDPEAELEACRAVCGADLRAALVACKSRDDIEGCRNSAREAMVACRKRCQTEAQGARQGCAQALRSCLDGCAVR